MKDKGKKNVKLVSFIVRQANYYFDVQETKPQIIMAKYLSHMRN
jgi:hypothetical protein